MFISNRHPGFEANLWLYRVITASNVIKRISMLDVFCMGVIVVCFAGAAYKTMGIVISLMHGMYPLVSAEVVHYVLYHLVHSCAPAEVAMGYEDLAREHILPPVQGRDL